MQDEIKMGKTSQMAKRLYIIEIKGGILMKTIAIAGGGYGGYKILKQLLQKGISSDVKIVLIDKTPYHTLKTEFYALAAGSVSDKSIRMNFPTHEQVEFVCDVVTNIDLQEQTLTLGHSGNVNYDYLIIGLGSEDNYRNIRGAREFAYSVQTIENTRRTYEAVQNVPPNGQVTIVGAGLTGVELASEIKESRPDLRVRLLDRGKTILPSLPKKLQSYVTKWLRENDVEVIHEAQVEYIEHGAVCNDGICLLTDVAIWAGGIKPNVVLDTLNVEKDHYGRIVLNAYHQIPTYTNVYVVGDCAALPHAPSAQVAQIQGKQIVAVLHSVLHGKTPKTPDEIVIKGAMGSLGKKEGFGTAYGVGVSGGIARLMKSGVLWIHKFNI